MSYPGRQYHNSGGYGQGPPPPQYGGYGGPPPQGYGPPQHQNSYGPPPPQQYGYGGPPPPGPYGHPTPPPQQYGGYNQVRWTLRRSSRDAVSTQSWTGRLMYIGTTTTTIRPWTTTTTIRPGTTATAAIRRPRTSPWQLQWRT
jgi:hypothetical protein